MTPPHRRRLLFVLLALDAVGVALIAVGIAGTTGWALMVPGLAAVIVSSAAVWAVREPPRIAGSGRDRSTLRARRFVGRVLRAVRTLTGDTRVPRPLRWLLAVSLLPIPGPFDEAVLVLVAPLLLVFHRAAMRDAWRGSASGASGPDSPTRPPPESPFG